MRLAKALTRSKWVPRSFKFGGPPANQGANDNTYRILFLGVATPSNA